MKLVNKNEFDQAIEEETRMTRVFYERITRRERRP